MSNSLAPERTQNRRPRVTRARGVNQHSHLDAAPLSLPQGARKLQPRFVPVEDISLERKCAAGLADGAQHGGIRFIAVNQRLDLIPHKQGPLHHAAHDPRQHVQMSGVAGQVAMQLFRRARRLRRVGAIALKVLAQQGGLAPKPVDAKDEIRQGTNQRHQPDKADPPDGSARVPLV